MAYVLLQLWLVLLIVDCAQCQVIAGQTPFNRSARRDDKTMQEILLKLQQFEKKSENQENLINQLQNDIKQLQQDNLEQANKIKQLETKLSKQVQQGSQMTMANSKQDEDLDNIKGQVNSQQNKLVEMKKANLKYEESFKKVAGIHDQYLEHISKQNTFVSFTAYANEFRDYNKDDVVLFDGIVVNYGGFYNASSSIFKCPYSGYYTFSMSVLADATYKMDVDIRLDGTQVVSAYARDADGYDQAAVTATVKCDSGQQVWVNSRINDNRMHGSGYRQSSFTGTLLRVI